MPNLFRITGGFFVVAVCALSSLAQQRSVALTFDDLPVAGTVDPPEARSINTAILVSLDRHHVPAIGFVIESRVQDIGKAHGQELLSKWVHGSTLIWSEEYSESSIVYGEDSFSRLRRRQAPETSLWEVP